MGKYNVATPERLAKKLSFTQTQMLLHVNIREGVYKLNYAHCFNIATLRKLCKLGLVHKECLTPLGIETRKLIIKREGIEARPIDLPKWS